jgi:hypothetical protein
VFIYRSHPKDRDLEEFNAFETQFYEQETGIPIGEPAIQDEKILAFLKERGAKTIHLIVEQEPDTSTFVPTGEYRQSGKYRIEEK